ncbi:hypothetical protein Tco_0479100 [Tanacetum coccineum]
MRSMISSYRSTSNLEEGYIIQKRHTFLDNLLRDDDSHNLASKGNVHQNSVIESLPISPIPVEDSEPTQEEIDILLVPDNLIPPGVEDADSEDELKRVTNLDHQDDRQSLDQLHRPPDIKKCFEPKAGILIIKEFKGVSKSHDFMTSILPTLPTLVSDLPFISSFVSFENEDTIFDPGIVTFLRAGGIF